mgnify:CR=1 FL=1
MGSKELKAIADQEDNDLKFLALNRKAFREKRLERFEEWLPTLKEKCLSVEFKEDNMMYQIEHYKHGKINFFPKANKLYLFRKDKWIKPGLQWIFNNIINQV